MSLSAASHYHATVITITGRFLGSIDGQAFKNQIDELKEEGQLRVVVDLGETTFMDSSGIGALIAGCTSLRKAKGDMRLANMKKRIHGLFAVTRLLGPVFENYESTEEALQSFQEHPEPKARPEARA